MRSVSKLIVIVVSLPCLVALASSDALAAPKKQRAPASSSQQMQSRGTALPESERIQRQDAWMFRSGGGGGGY